MLPKNPYSETDPRHLGYADAQRDMLAAGYGLLVLDAERREKIAEELWRSYSPLLHTKYWALSWDRLSPEYKKPFLEGGLVPSSASPGRHREK